jgi:hypothetical protein
MRDFFRPFRRRMGCVTLVMASMFMAAWARSLTVTDEVEFGRFSVLLCSGAIVVETCDLEFVSPYYHAHAVEDFEAQLSKMPSFKWRWRFLGCGKGDYADGPDDAYWFVSYWCIILSLTLLSAYLLLSTPHPRSEQPVPHA